MLVAEMGGQVGTHRDGAEILSLHWALRGAWTCPANPQPCTELWNTTLSPHGLPDNSSGVPCFKKFKNLHQQLWSQRVLRWLLWCPPFHPGSHSSCQCLGTGVHRASMTLCSADGDTLMLGINETIAWTPDPFGGQDLEFSNCLKTLSWKYQGAAVILHSRGRSSEVWPWRDAQLPAFLFLPAKPVSV